MGTISRAPFPALAGDTVKVSAEQMAAVLLAISGLGFTSTVRSKGFPTQVPLLGVSSYTMDCWVLVVLRRVWVNEDCAVA